MTLIMIEIGIPRISQCLDLLLPAYQGFFEVRSSLKYKKLVAY